MVNNMDRLEEDLRYFRQQLEVERDPFRRNQIRNVEAEILNLLRQERQHLERENLEDALELAKRMKKK